MAKNNKRQNNALIFNALVNGLSWDQVMEMQDEMKRQDNVKPPTRKDILTDWIISKDYMLQQQGNSFDLGGITGVDWSSGNFKYTGENGEPVIGNTNWLGAASSALQFVGDALSGYNDIENKTDAFNTQLNQFQNQRFNIGDNAFLAQEWDNRMLLGNTPTKEQFGYKSGWKVGLSALQNGLATAATTGNIWLGAGMAVADMAKNIGLNAKAKSEQERIAAIHDIAQDQQPQLYNYSVNESQLLNTLKQRQNMAKDGGKLNKSHKFAEGGLLNTYDYGLEEVNAGGSHEENPNEGVVVSYAPDGLPNKVEEGETIHNDYVYSKRLEANEKVLENNLLDKKYKGKSFAEISKKLTEDRKERPNDPISVRTNEENLDRLQGAQEELKLDNKTKEVKRFLGSLDNDQLNALQQEMMEEYEAYAEQLAQQQEAEDQAYQEEQAAQEGMFGNGGHLYQTRGKLITPITDWAWSDYYLGNSPMDDYVPVHIDYSKPWDVWDTQQYFGQEPVVITEQSPRHKSTIKTIPLSKKGINQNAKSIHLEDVSPMNDYVLATNPLAITSSTTSVQKNKIGTNASSDNNPTAPKGNSYSSLAPLRFAEAFGSAGQYLSDILGLTNQPDYGNARMYQRAIDNIGGVNFTPIGDYVTHTPIDTEYLANQQMATAAARRNYGNVAGDYTLGLLNDYNTLNQIGATAIAAKQQDREQSIKDAEFNRTTNAKNSEMSLDTQKQNAALRAQRAQEYRYLADMMTKERVDNEAARAANYQNFMSNVAAIGKEDYNYDFIRWAAQNGLLKPGALKNYPGLFGYLS